MAGSVCLSEFYRKLACVGTKMGRFPGFPFQEQLASAGPGGTMVEAISIVTQVATDEFI